MGKSKITDKQNDVLLVVSRVGCVPLGMERELGLRIATCKTLQELGYLQTREVLDKDNNICQMYVSTSKSQNYFATHFASSYKGTTKTYHDIELAYQYSKLSDSEKDTFQTENQTRSYFEDCLYNRYQGEDRQEIIERYENNGISVPDCSYVSDEGTMEVIEVISQSYRGEVIREKQLVAKVMGANFNSYKSF